MVADRQGGQRKSGLKTLKYVAGTVVLGVALLVQATHAQNAYPTKPIRLVVSTTAGSQPDGLARMFAHEMHKRWGKPVVVDNRPAANGILAAGAVAKAAPDGYTLLYVLPQFVISAATQASLPYEPYRDFTAVAQIGSSTNLLVAGPQLGVKTVKELIAMAQAQPGKLIFGSGATGTADHLSGARFNMAAGIKTIHVAFKGGPDAIIEILAGRSHYNVGTMGVVLPFIRDGKLVALAVTAPKRSALLPDVPALAETLAEFKKPETSHGIVAPTGTPRAILDQLSKEMAREFELPEVKERTQAISFELAHAGPDEYNSLLRAQLESTSKVVRDAGLRAR